MRVRSDAYMPLIPFSNPRVGETFATPFYALKRRAMYVVM